MKKGFMKWLRGGFIQTYPGLTAKEYADQALKGDVPTDAENEIQSLSTTLMKQVREGKEPGIRRERIGGKDRYFPVTGVPITTSSENIAVQILLSKQELQDVDNLVTGGKFHNRNEAIEWLVKRCITLKSGNLGYPYWH